MTKDKSDPTLSRDNPAVVDTKYWHHLDDGRVQCDLCPRACKIHPGQRGLCFVRANVDESVVLTTYGRSTGFCVDPIEKKPLNHFYPGSSVLSFGTAGCNLFCRFCQNWDISKSKQVEILSSVATPEMIADAASDAGCKSVAYTYNDPVIFHEYAIDVARACREKGIKSVAVSAGYVCEEPRKEFYQHMDAVNIDLKAFTEDFYWKLTGSHLKSVLETLVYLKKETDVWVEITTLVIPGENDSEKELNELSEWVVNELGPDVPLHFSAFHPDFKMRDIPATPKETLIKARNIAMKNGVRYAYTGNVHHREGDATYCHGCGELLIQRDWYDLSEWHLDPQGRCQHCQTPLAGVFDEAPGNWGRKRVAMRF
ncbi:MAG: AmmeMemoRadiSam system radical SAM enzyme [Ketobacteraceae bacterium]|nr:AmmeMemoRadiSam system radical SAM enzyme [Ketobacteraceae bacterium]